MDTEMTRYESFAEVTEDFYCSAVDVLKILVLRLHDYHARCFHSLRDALYDYFSTDAAPHTHANVSTNSAPASPPVTMMPSSSGIRSLSAFRCPLNGRSASFKNKLMKRLPPSTN